MGKTTKRRTGVDPFAGYSDEEIVQMVTMLVVYPTLACVDRRTGEPITDATEAVLFVELARRQLVDRAAQYAAALGEQDGYAAVRAATPSDGGQA